MKLIRLASLIIFAGALIGWVWWQMQQKPVASASSVAPAPSSAATADKSLHVIAPVAARAGEPLPVNAVRYTIEGQTVAALANDRGEFSRVYTPASALIEIDTPVPGAEVGERLPVQAEDGGLLAAGVENGFVAVSEPGRARFAYRVAAHDGMHRVTLRRGGASRVFEFWVGEDPEPIDRLSGR
jgi:hypothetical protein